MPVSYWDRHSGFNKMFSMKLRNAASLFSLIIEDNFLLSQHWVIAARTVCLYEQEMVHKCSGSSPLQSVNTDAFNHANVVLSGVCMHWFVFALNVCSMLHWGPRGRVLCTLKWPTSVNQPFSSAIKWKSPPVDVFKKPFLTFYRHVNQ